MTALLSSLASMFLAWPRTVSSQSESYRPDDFARLAGGGNCPVMVHGNPFADRGWSDGAFTAAVLAAMQGQSPGPSTRFVAHAPSDARPAYCIVLSFNGSATVGDPCAAPPGRIRVFAVWCVSGTALSECSGRVAGVRSPTDRRFARLIAQVTRELFPMLVGPGGLKGH